MERKIVEIEPFETVTIKHKHSFSINIIDIKIFKSVMISVEFFDENNDRVDVARLQLTGDDYSNWGTDDNYLVNYVANKYGMTVKAPTVQATEPAAQAPFPDAPVVE